MAEDEGEPIAVQIFVTDRLKTKYVEPKHSSAPLKHACTRAPLLMHFK